MEQFKLNKGLINIDCGYSQKYILLGDYKNIGNNAVNLTIVILSCNRSDLTIKLINSLYECVPEYEGKVLIFDNGSMESELKKVEKFILKYPNSYIKKSNDNIGVATGRNRAFNYVDTEWIMSLDNDIYFIDNPFEKIKEAISTLGCKFLNIPLLNDDKSETFANGGAFNLDILEDGSLFLEVESMYKNVTYEKNMFINPSYSSFLYGGASIINKKVFDECGGFDKNYFVGYEDIDFSLKLFKEGYKIGSVGVLCLVHDHKIDKTQSGVEYEKIRFSNKKILEAAIYFEKKHGIKVWSEETEKWLKEQVEIVGLKSDLNVINIKKPKIALIVDVPNWAFHNIARRIKIELSEYFDFSIFILKDYEFNTIKLLLNMGNYDLVHFFWRDQLNFFVTEEARLYLRKFNIDIECYKKEFLSKINISTAIYDHLFLEIDQVGYTKNILSLVNSYYVSSKKLYNIYNNFDVFKKPETIITDGVDLSLFKPKKLNRLKDLSSRKLIIGWAGNSIFTDTSMDNDVKGFRNIIKPAIEELIKKGYQIKAKFADRQEKMIPFEKMPNYYNEIDLYVCMSKYEGTPNPILESMACGIPIITTDVGIVFEVFGDKQKEFILKERTKEALQKKIIYLLENNSLLEELSKENLNQIASWDWKIKIQEFKKYFDKIIKKVK